MVTITPNGDVPQQPMNFDNSYLPDQLIAGVYPRVTANVTVTSGATVNSVTPLPRGTVLGQSTIGAATFALKAGDTGNATCSAVTVAANAKVGVYIAKFLTATTFNVFDPLGNEVGQGTLSAAFANEIGFTMAAGGTAMVAGDQALFTVAAGAGNYIPSVATATDGSQVPSAILADQCDPSAGAVTAGVYLTGEFNLNAITFDSGYTAAALAPLLRPFNIFLKSANVASDPN
jgi:hypothetical protein